MEMVSRDVLPQLMDWLTLGHFALCYPHILILEPQGKG